MDEYTIKLRIRPESYIALMSSAIDCAFVWLEPNGDGTYTLASAGPKGGEIITQHREIYAEADVHGRPLLSISELKELIAGGVRKETSVDDAKSVDVLGPLLNSLNRCWSVSPDLQLPVVQCERERSHGGSHHNGDIYWTTEND